jgi:geranylgeranyl pyrophosphate synthase
METASYIDRFDFYVPFEAVEITDKKELPDGWELHHHPIDCDQEFKEEEEAEDVMYPTTIYEILDQVAKTHELAKKCNSYKEQIKRLEHLLAEANSKISKLSK